MRRTATSKHEIAIGESIEIHHVKWGVTARGVVTRLSDDRIFFSSSLTGRTNSWALTDAGLADYENGPTRNAYNTTYVLSADESASNAHWQDVHRKVDAGIAEGRIQRSGVLGLLGF